MTAILLGLAARGNRLAKRALEGLDPPPYNVYGSLVSAIIPTFNEEEYIENCIVSLQHQTFEPIEIIVVDHNSQDKTVEVSKNCGAKVFTIDEPGVGPARDLGLLAAQGDPLFFTDADAIHENRLIEEMVEDLREVDAVTVRPVYYRTNVLFQAGMVFNRYSRYRHSWLLSGRATLIPKEVLVSVGGWEVPIWEERHLSKKLRAAGYTVKTRRDLAVATSDRRWRGGSRALRLSGA